MFLCKVPNKYISLLLVGIFVWVDFAISAPAGGSINTTVSNKPYPTNLSLIDIPLEYSAVKEFHEGSNGKLIIHIQDPHANFALGKHRSYRRAA